MTDVSDAVKWDVMNERVRFLEYAVTALIETHPDPRAILDSFNAHYAIRETAAAMYGRSEDARQWAALMYKAMFGMIEVTAQTANPNPTGKGEGHTARTRADSKLGSSPAKKAE
ncbi:MAG: hypothetical protein ACM3SS_19620 [Rhodospirillaceae bacterium]